MRTLKFNTVEQTLRKNPNCDFSDLVSGTEGYLNAEFDFSSEWFGCKKAAVFTSTTGSNYPVPIVNNHCDIPKEVLTDYYFKVHVVGIKDDYKLVTNDIRVNQKRR